MLEKKIIDREINLFPVKGLFYFLLIIFESLSVFLYTFLI